MTYIIVLLQDDKKMEKEDGKYIRLVYYLLSTLSTQHNISNYIGMLNFSFYFKVFF